MMMMMDTLNDDVLSLIFSYFDEPRFRNSIAQVSKCFLRLERLTRCFLRVREPDFLHPLLSKFPNLRELVLQNPINNTHLEIISKTCPIIEVLNLKLEEHYVRWGLFIKDGFDVDFGVAAIAKGCPKLRVVSLRNRKGVGNLGVISLVNSAMNLTTLDLGWCEIITDDALKGIGESKSIISLNMQGCSRITDCGLAFLVKGTSSKNLKTLVIAECGQITDSGVSLLQNMCCLEVLDMAECGGGSVADGGCLEIATKLGGTLKQVNFSCLSITDDTVIAVARNCLKLTWMKLNRCGFVTGVGIRALSNHGSLLYLSMAMTLSNDVGKDVEYMVLRSPNLRRIVLDTFLRGVIPKSVVNNIENCCLVIWTTGF